MPLPPDKKVSSIMGFWTTPFNWSALTLAIVSNKVKIENAYSNWHVVQCGVQQGSLLGPLLFNPLTPVPPVTGCDEPWPFHFWPKLASSILDFCRRKRSFQWCPDQSDWPNGAWDMHKMLKTLSKKLRPKFPATTHGCAMVKIACLDDAFLEVF